MSALAIDLVPYGPIWYSCYKPDPTGNYFVFFDSADYSVPADDPDALLWSYDLFLGDYLFSKGIHSYKASNYGNRTVCGDSTGQCSSSSANDGRSGSRTVYMWVADGTSGATVVKTSAPTEAEVRDGLVGGIPQVTLTDVINPDGLSGPDFTFATPGDHSLDYAVRLGLGIPQPSSPDPTDSDTDPLNYLDSAFTYMAKDPVPPHNNTIYHFFDGKDANSDGTFDGLTYDVQYYEVTPGVLDIYTNIRWGLARFDNGGSPTGSNCSGSDADFPGCGANLLVSLPDEYSEGTSADAGRNYVQFQIINMTPSGYTPLADSMRNLDEYFFAPANKADLAAPDPPRNDTDPTMYVDHQCDGEPDDHIVQADPAYLHQCRQNFVIFVTDGDQTMGLGCLGACATTPDCCNILQVMDYQQYWVNQLKQGGDIWQGVKVFLIGFALNGNLFAQMQLEGMADASQMGPDDPYTEPFYASNETEFRAALNQIMEVIQAAAVPASAACASSCPGDQDRDGLPDDWEEIYTCMQVQVPDNLADYDSDGLNNEEEYFYFTDPCEADTDNDGLTDGAEVDTYGTDPLDRDTDGDGMPDGWEVTYLACVDPLTGDSLANPDGDGLSNLAEYLGGTDPCVSDCVDNDGDAYGANCLSGPDCNDADPDNWTACASCLDGDGDNWFVGCNAYLIRQGPDCKDADPDNWTACASCLDADGDNWFAGCNAYIIRQGQDCNDADETIHPKAREILCDGVDQNCNGLGDDDADADGDGVSVCEDDCNDNNAEVHPGAREVCGNGIDENCSGADKKCGEGWGGGGGGCLQIAGGSCAGLLSLLPALILLGIRLFRKFSN